ncbi:MAG: tRNA (guanosine(46)-N7)-methyltransferase TrmB [Chloroflexi bacterium]|nr:tRNA (guanosine(46)-N7)-methyltransferase TrmB [Chloroflexota bacterium]
MPTQSTAPAPPKLSSLTLPWPTDWPGLFGRAAPLILEIGFGTGTFLVHLARSRPDANLVGLEISNRSLVTMEKAVVRERLTNVRVVHSLAETALHHLFTPGALAQVYINFPDPWFKTRHSHRRLMQRDTLDALVSRLEPGGVLYLATDIIEYAQMSHRLLRATPGLDNQLAAAWSTEPLPGRIVTKYEAKAHREGRACYYFAYRRNDQPAPPVPVIKDLAMPHIVFNSPLTLAAIQAAFAPAQHTIPHGAGALHISWVAAYRSETALLFEVHIGEPTITQRLALTLIQRSGGDFTLQMSTLGQPRPTAGVHHAVRLLGDWLIGLHPDAHAKIQKVQPADAQPPRD